MNSQIIQLITALQKIGLDPTAEELADIVWLATHIDQPKLSKSGLETLSDRQIFNAGNKQLLEVDRQKASIDQESESPNKLTDSTELYLFQTEEIKESVEFGSLTFRSPTATALPGALELGRVLRPFKRRVPSRTQVMLDEEGTVRYIIDKGDWLPVMRPAPARWLDLILVIDASPSMVIWQQTINELHRLFENQGAFRTIQTWHFDTTETGLVRLYTGRDSLAVSKQERNANELVDPSGQRLILVISDCVSSAWYQGYLTKILGAWGQYNIVAIVQMLSQRLWSRTALGDALSVQLRAKTPGTPNNQLEVARPWDWFDKKLPSGLAVPIVTLEPWSLAPWAKSVAGIGNAWIPGIILPMLPLKRANFSRSEAVSTSTEGTNPLTPVKQLQLFRAIASPLAWKLARYLAASPLSLPVIRLVQRVMLPQSRQVHLAEVLLSSLIKRVTPYEVAIHPDEVQYDFIGDIRELLLSTNLISETIDVLAEVSRFVDCQTGLPLDFRAILADPTTTDRIAIEKGSQPFANVATKVLRQLGGNYAQLAARLEARLSYNSISPLEVVDIKETEENSIQQDDAPQELEPLVEQPADKQTTSLIVEKSGLYYPNKMGRTYLMAMEEVMGTNGIKAVLNLANTPWIIGNYPPNNLAREFDFADFGAIGAAIEEMYGLRGARGLALRSGRASFAQGLSEFGSVVGASELAFKVIPLLTKVKVGLKATAETFTKFSDQISDVEEMDDHFVYTILKCPDCWGRTSEKPICYVAVGILHEALRWVSGGKDFKVEEKKCHAAGDENCVFYIYKEPLN